jgi:hypothetical protein
MDPTELFREGLLTGRGIALAGVVRPAVSGLLAGLGARTAVFDERLDDQAAEALARAEAPLHALVYDAGAGSPGEGAEGLLASTERAWIAIHAVAVGALIPGGAGGKVILLAPPPRAWQHAGAARAAFENIARTLSVEWARYAITATAITPGAASTEEELATLVGYLASPAGDYFSGCRFELGAVR